MALLLLSRFLPFFIYSPAFLYECATCICLFLLLQRERIREKRASEKIDRELAADAERRRHVRRVVLFGAPGAGHARFLELLCRCVHAGSLPGLHLLQFSGLKQPGGGGTAGNGEFGNESRLLSLPQSLVDCFRGPAVSALASISAHLPSFPRFSVLNPLFSGAATAAVADDESSSGEKAVEMSAVQAPPLQSPIRMSVQTATSPASAFSFASASPVSSASSLS